MSTLLEFQRGLLEHFDIKDYRNVYCSVTSWATNRPTINILAFDDILHERHDVYENQRLCMSQVIIKYYGEDAHDWFLAHLTQPSI